MSYKEEFPYFHHNPDAIYLDSAATTQKPKSVLDAMHHFYEKEYATVHRALYPASEKATCHYEETRSLVAKLLGVSAEEIVWTHGTTEGINLIAQGMGHLINPGDEIFVSAMEHHANLLPWQRLAEQKGAHLKIIPLTPECDLDLDWLSSHLSSKAKIVAVTHISNVLGTINPIEKISSLLIPFGTLLIVDGAQSFGQRSINLQQLGADFYVASFHKAFGPTAIGFLFGKQSLLEKMQPLLLGGSMLLSTTYEKPLFANPPHRFEAGTPPIAEVIGVKALMEWMDHFDLNQWAFHKKELSSLLEKGLGAMEGIEIIGHPKERAAIISIVFNKSHPYDVATLLGARNIAVRTGHLCAQPLINSLGHSSVLRISPSIYNDASTITTFLNHLQEILTYLKNPT